MQAITVATFRFPTDPDFIMFTTELERAGIEYICPEKNQLSVDPMLSISFGGLRVMVDASDVDRAKAIYDEAIGQSTAIKDEADLEIEQMKAADEAAFTKNHRTCLVGLVVLSVAIRLVWAFLRS